MIKALTALSVLGIALMSAPAEARRGTSSVITVDNNLHGSVKVFVDGSYLGRVHGGSHVNMYVSPGTHAVRLVQSRHDCVLSADIMDLPWMSQVQYRVDRRCSPHDYRGSHRRHHHGVRGTSARWSNPDIRWVPGRYTPVLPDPVYVSVQEHYGPLIAPVVLTHGPRAASSRGGSGYRGHHGHRGRDYDRYGRDDRRDHRKGGWNHDDRGHRHDDDRGHDKDRRRNDDRDRGHDHDRDRHDDRGRNDDRDRNDRDRDRGRDDDRDRNDDRGRNKDRPPRRN